MHLAVQLHVLNDVAPVGLERAAKVVEADSGDGADEAVGDARRELSPEFTVLAVAAPATHHVHRIRGLSHHSTLKPLQQAADVRWVVLEVPVHGDDDRAPSRFNARGHRGRLAEISAEAQHPQLRVGSGCPLQGRPGAVSASVVDANNFVGLFQGIQGAEELLKKRLDIPLFVEERDDYRQLGKPLRRAVDGDERPRGPKGVAGHKLVPAGGNTGPG